MSTYETIRLFNTVLNLHYNEELTQSKIAKRLRLSTAKANRETDSGYITYQCSLPAVVSVIKGINEPRYPTMKGILGAKRKTVDAKDAATLSLDASRIGLAGAKTKVTTARVAEARKAGVKVEDDGSGAKQLADFLAGEKLV